MCCSFWINLKNQIFHTRDVYGLFSAHCFTLIINMKTANSFICKSETPEEVLTPLGFLARFGELVRYNLKNS